MKSPPIAQIIPANYPTWGYVIAIIRGNNNIHRLIYVFFILSFSYYFLYKSNKIYDLKHPNIKAVAANNWQKVQNLIIDAKISSVENWFKQFYAIISF